MTKISFVSVSFQFLTKLAGTTLVFDVQAIFVITFSTIFAGEPINFTHVKGNNVVPLTCTPLQIYFTIFAIANFTLEVFIFTETKVSNNIK